MEYNIHEDFYRHETITPPTDRRFGAVFALVFFATALWPRLRGQPIRWWALAVSASFAGIAVLRPSVLALLNRIWLQFGLLLGRVVSPIALTALYCLAVVPVGFLMSAFGKDPLRLSLDRSAETYWVPREPPGPAPDSLDQQF